MRLGSKDAVTDLVDEELVVYDIVLLAGSPRRLSLSLTPEITPESVIEVDDELWMVADVRTAIDAPTQLICIYADE